MRTVGVQPKISAATFEKLGGDKSFPGHYTVTVSERVRHASPQPKLYQNSAKFALEVAISEDCWSLTKDQRCHL